VGGMSKVVARMVWEDHVDNLLGDSGQHIKDVSS
jgi:hypothetical protein